MATTPHKISKALKLCIPKFNHVRSPTKFAVRLKSTTSEYVASRPRDPTFEKLMEKYKNLLKVFAIQDLILANPKNPAVSLQFLSKLSQKLHFNHGAASFLRKYPHIFHIFYDTSKSQPFCRFTDEAFQICREEAAAIDASYPLVTERLVRILSMSVSKTVPLRAVFKVWRELGLPDSFEDSVISKNPNLFMLCENPQEHNTHLLKLVDSTIPEQRFSAAVDEWRINECGTEIEFSFKQEFPPGMRLRKDFRSKLKEWQKLPYLGPYEEMPQSKKSSSSYSKMEMMKLEKRAAGIVHEFLSLTVEKMVEVEKISHFRKWFGIDLNIRDLFLDHPGMFYLSTKAKRHSVFLREAYERGCLIRKNPIYEARRKLLHLLSMGRRGLVNANKKESCCYDDNQEIGWSEESGDYSDDTRTMRS